MAKAVTLFLLGPVVCVLVQKSDELGFSFGDLAWPVFLVGLFLTMYGLLALLHAFDVRNLWRSGDILPASVVRPARMPLLRPWMLSLLVVILLLTREVPGAALGVGVMAVSFISKRLNSARVLFVVDGKSVVKSIPVGNRWRSLRKNDFLFVTAIKERAAALHVVAPVPYDELEVDPAAQEEFLLELTSAVRANRESST